MVFKVQFSDQSLADFDRVFDHLAIAYLNFGEPVELAFNKAAERVSQIKNNLITLKHHPYRGTTLPHLRPHLRHLTVDRAIIYFEIDEAEKLVHVISVFFSGQDHLRHMAERLTSQTSGDA